MGSKIIGFVGAEKYDILLYLSRILSRLKQKILLVDYSENRALTYCIPSTIREICGEYIKKQKAEVMEEKISYLDVDFMMEPRYRDLLLVKEEYDLILVDFGYQVHSQLLSECSQIFLCVDQQLHNICQLKPLKRVMEHIEERSYLLFRQVYDCKISTEYLMEELELELPKDKIFEYYQETNDMKYCIDSQYNYSFQFTRLSKGLKCCILFILRQIVPSLSEQQRKNAYRCARRGNLAVRKR